MAIYKVPQNVEADDKLIGPFTFRQFIYLIIVSLAIALAWGLSQISVPLAVVPLPIITLFGALALPLRKDQPMEMYLAAMVSFLLKPHRRLWDPDGIDSLIEITTPKMVEVQRMKDLSQTEAQRRFSYLAQIADTQGWAIRGPGVQAPNSALTSDVYFEAQQVQDIMDSDTSTSQFFSNKLDQNNIRKHQDMVNLIHKQPVAAPQSASNTSNYFGGVAAIQGPPIAPEPIIKEHLEYNPYPEDIRQAVIEPIDISRQSTAKLTRPETTTSEKPLAAGIISLANNTDLSIETIAREANRITKGQNLNEEVTISLR
jgi:hypothetical protein